VVRVTPTLAWAVLAGVVLGFGLWSIISLAPRMSGPRLARRIAPYLADVSAGARESLAPPASGPLPVVAVLIEPLVMVAREALAAVLGGDELLARRLRQSGSSQTVSAFRSRQLMWGAVGAASGIVVAIAAARLADINGVLQLGVIVLAAVTGVLAPDYLLQRAANQRLARLADELPIVLEFLTLSLSAGEGIVDAVRRISRVSAGELSKELAAVVAAVSTGLPFGETLARLAHDLELPAFTRCVDQIVGALERGTPLSEVLRAQAQDARDDAKRGLLELAGKKEVGMLVPLVFMILPITIAFAIFPGIFVLQVGF